MKYHTQYQAFAKMQTPKTSTAEQKRPVQPVPAMAETQWTCGCGHKNYGGRICGKCGKSS